LPPYNGPTADFNFYFNSKSVIVPVVNEVIKVDGDWQWEVAVIEGSTFPALR
jgi:hypothetical protein